MWTDRRNPSTDTWTKRGASLSMPPQTRDGRRTRALKELLQGRPRSRLSRAQDTHTQQRRKCASSTAPLYVRRYLVSANNWGSAITLVPPLWLIRGSGYTTELGQSEKPMRSCAQGPSALTRLLRPRSGRQHWPLDLRRGPRTGVWTAQGAGHP